MTLAILGGTGKGLNLCYLFLLQKRRKNNINKMMKKNMMMMTKRGQHEKIPEKESSGWLPAALGADKSLKIADS